MTDTKERTKTMANRAERRRESKQKEAKYTLNRSQIQQMKEDCMKDAIDYAFRMMIGVPILVLHDKFAQLMKREVNGKSREERFLELMLAKYEEVEGDYTTLEAILEVIEEECGLKIMKEEV